MSATTGEERPTSGTRESDRPRYRATCVRSSICAREGRERLQGGRIPWCGADEASIQPGGHTNRTADEVGMSSS